MVFRLVYGILEKNAQQSKKTKGPECNRTYNQNASTKASWYVLSNLGDQVKNLCKHAVVYAKA